jgi:LysM repeat protein
MGENVTYFGELADRYDVLVKYDEKILDNYVEESGYSLGSMVLASTALAFMKFSQTFTDMGRLGNGILIEGGVKGVAKDALRAVNIFGTAGAVAGRASTLLKVVQASNANTCAIVAQTNALRLSGNRFLITIEELAKEANISLPKVAAVGRGADDYQKMLTAMRQMGIAARELTPANSTFEGLVQSLRAAGKGVVTFSVRFGANGVNGHRLYATIGRAGELIIRDPAAPGVIKSLAELRSAFPQATLSSSEIIFVPDALLVTASHAAQAATEVSMFLKSLAMQVLPVVHVQAQDSETALQVLHVREGIRLIPPAPPRIHTVRSGDWLSKIAKTYYGNMYKWPLIYEANRKVIGRNPNLIRPGQKLIIPNLPRTKSTRVH